MEGGVIRKVANEEGGTIAVPPPRSVDGPSNGCNDMSVCVIGQVDWSIDLLCA